jgi:hypothetical protein
MRGNGWAKEKSRQAAQTQADISMYLSMIIICTPVKGLA